MQAGPFPRYTEISLVCKQDGHPLEFSSVARKDRCRDNKTKERASNWLGEIEE
jgi:hypothetical protein